MISTLLILFLIASCYTSSLSLLVRPTSNVKQLRNQKQLLKLQQPFSNKRSSSALEANIFENEPGDIVPENAIPIGILGTLSNLVCFYSLYVLKTTSCGLPPGYLGIEGAIEGISYLVVVSIFGWSLLKKIQTGSGLPTDRFGLLGLAEGLSFLTILGGIAIAILNLQEYGFLPGFLPNDKCFGIND